MSARTVVVRGDGEVDARVICWHPVHKTTLLPRIRKNLISISLSRIDCRHDGTCR
jgi:hypothetical protein